jgi:hypothetical protein
MHCVCKVEARTFLDISSGAMTEENDILDSVLAESDQALLSVDFVPGRGLGTQHSQALSRGCGTGKNSAFRRFVF